VILRQRGFFFLVFEMSRGNFCCGSALRIVVEVGLPCDAVLGEFSECSSGGLLAEFYRAARW
jgi:hypothetical protein